MTNHPTKLEELKLMWWLLRRKVGIHKLILVALATTFQRITRAGTAVLTDNLTFECLCHVTGLYKIRVSTVEEISDGTATLVKKHYDEWKAVFSQSTKQLYEVGGERICTFSIEKNQLFIGYDVYNGLPFPGGMAPINFTRPV